MKIIRCEFIDSNEDMDIKRRIGVDQESDAIVQRDNLKYYYSRKEIVELIKNCYKERELPSPSL